MKDNVCLSRSRVISPLKITRISKVKAIHRFHLESLKFSLFSGKFLIVDGILWVNIEKENTTTIFKCYEMLNDPKLTPDLNSASCLLFSSHK